MTIDMPNKKEFTELYLSKISRDDIAEKYYISLPTLDSWAKHFGISRKLVVPTKTDIEDILKTDLGREEMAVKANCSIPTFRKYMKLYGLEHTFNRNVTKIDMDELYRLRVDCQWTYKDLAELYQTSDFYIRKQCVRLGFPEVKVGRVCEWKLANNKISMRGILR